jgi:uncharacterized protein (DUF305 family)
MILEKNMYAQTRLIALVLAAASIATAAMSQEIAYPEKCKAADSMAMQHDQMMESPGMEMAEFQKEFMDGMHKTAPLMMDGMMKDDADVAFVCGMIAHHMGAIEMSKTELKHGDNAEAKAMAQKIIDAQVKEIEEMSKWVEANAK